MLIWTVGNQKGSNYVQVVMCEEVIAVVTLRARYYLGISTCSGAAIKRGLRRAHPYGNYPKMMIWVPGACKRTCFLCSTEKRQSLSRNALRCITGRVGIMKTESLQCKKDAPPQCGL